MSLDRIAVAAAELLLAAVIGCQDQPPSHVSPSEVHNRVDKIVNVVPADNGKTLTVCAGQDVLVTLPSTRIGDMGWWVDRIDVTEGPTQTVVNGGSSWSPADSSRPEGDGSWRARLQALYPGRATITLLHKKHYAPAQEADGTFTLTIVVELGAAPDEAALKRHGRPTINLVALCKALADETGQPWVVHGNRVEVRTPEQLYSVYCGDNQSEQSLILEPMESWQRAMAIVWSSNGWSLVGDMDAWSRSGETTRKIVGVLTRYRPSHDCKTPRQAASAEPKPSAAATSPSSEPTDLVVSFYKVLLQKEAPTLQQEKELFGLSSALRTNLLARRKGTDSDPVVLQLFRQHRDLFLPLGKDLTTEDYLAAVQISSPFNFVRSLKGIKDEAPVGRACVMALFVHDVKAKPSRFRTIVFDVYDEGGA